MRRGSTFELLLYYVFPFFSRLPAIIFGQHPIRLVTDMVFAFSLSPPPPRSDADASVAFVIGGGDLHHTTPHPRASVLVCAVCPCLLGLSTEFPQCARDVVNQTNHYSDQASFCMLRGCKQNSSQIVLYKLKHWGYHTMVGQPGVEANEMSEGMVRPDESIRYQKSGVRPRVFRAWPEWG